MCFTRRLLLLVTDPARDTRSNVPSLQLLPALDQHFILDRLQLTHLLPPGYHFSKQELIQVALLLLIHLYQITL